MPTRRQAIIWTNDGYFTDAIGPSELKTVICVIVAFGCDYSDQSLFEITWRGIWF